MRCAITGAKGAQAVQLLKTQGRTTRLEQCWIEGFDLPIHAGLFAGSRVELSHCMIVQPIAPKAPGWVVDASCLMAGGQGPRMITLNRCTLAGLGLLSATGFGEAGQELLVQAKTTVVQAPAFLNWDGAVPRRLALRGPGQPLHDHGPGLGRPAAQRHRTDPGESHQPRILEHRPDPRGREPGPHFPLPERCRGPGASPRRLHAAQRRSPQARCSSGAGRAVRQAGPLSGSRSPRRLPFLPALPATLTGRQTGDWIIPVEWPISGRNARSGAAVGRTTGETEPSTGLRERAWRRGAGSGRGSRG